jgi:hypothetical protein
VNAESDGKSWPQRSEKANAQSTNMDKKIIPALMTNLWGLPQINAHDHERRSDGSLQSLHRLSHLGDQHGWYEAFNGSCDDKGRTPLHAQDPRNAEPTPAADTHKIPSVFTAMQSATTEKENMG